LIEYKRRIELESVVDNIKDIFRLTTEVWKRLNETPPKEQYTLVPYVNANVDPPDLVASDSLHFGDQGVINN
jgi:hypothetical protein